MIRTYEELGNLFREPEKISDGYREKYEAERSWACPRDDGEVCRRTADALLHGKKSGVSVKCSDADKKKLLVYGGKFSDNDRTETFMSLMNNIDYNKFDITVLAEAVTEEGSRRLNELNPGARVLYWKPFYAASGKELARHSLLEQAKEESTICTPYEFYRREKIRAAGDARFDGVLDFAGDSAVFHRMTEQMKGILQVSLVEGTGFRCSMPVNLERIRAEEKQQRVLETEKGREYIASIREMEDGSQEVETVALPDQDTYNFVTLGSLTQENHYEKLIQCFAELGDRKKLHLYILGDGPRKGKLEALVKEKGLESRVSFLGYLQYPLGFIAQCSCFALNRNPEIRIPGFSGERRWGLLRRAVIRNWAG